MKKLKKYKYRILGVFALVFASALSVTCFGESVNHMLEACSQMQTVDAIKTFVAPASMGTFGAALAALPGLAVLTDGKETFQTKSAEDLGKLEKEAYKTYVSDLMDFQSKNISYLSSQLKEAKEESKAGLEKQITDLVKANNETLMESLKAQGLVISSLQKELGGNSNISNDEVSQISKFISDNASEIKKLKEVGSGTIEFTTKTVGAITTGNASLPVAAPTLQGVQVAPPSNANLRTATIDSVVTTFNTSLASYAYTETLPKDGDFGFVAEGAIKPQIDFEPKTRYAAPVKIAAHMVLTEEAVEDIPGLQSIAFDYLRKKHDLKRQDGILFGTGQNSQPTGATDYGRVFTVSGTLLASVPSPNIMDVINAAITDIYTTHNYTDEEPYMANIVMLNPIDFFIQFSAAKDADGKPLFPAASLFSSINIGGLTIIPHYKIPAGKIFIADMSMYNVTNYIPYTVRIGWINAQFIYNQFTIVGESRMHAFVRKLDEQAFIYDDISTIKTAITKPATPPD